MKNKSKSHVRVSDNPFAKNFAEQEEPEEEEDLLMDYETVVPVQKSVQNLKNGKRRKEKKGGESEGVNGVSRSRSSFNGDGGYRAREVDLSEVPPHLLSSLIKCTPEPGPLSTDAINPEEMEGWIIQCPKRVDLRRILRGQRLNMDGGPVILSPDEVVDMDNVYEAVAVQKSEDKEENVFLILGDEGEDRFKMASVPLGGYITVRKHIEDVALPEVQIRKKKTRKLPSGIKERHPIYGVDFSEALSNVRVTRRGSSPSKRRKQGYEDQVSNYIEKLSFSKSNKKAAPVQTPTLTLAPRPPPIPPQPQQKKKSISATYDIPTPTPTITHDLPKTKRKKSMSVTETESFDIPPIITIPTSPPKKNKKSISATYDIPTPTLTPVPKTKKKSISAVYAIPEPEPLIPETFENMTISSPKKDKSRKRKRDSFSNIELEDQVDLPIMSSTPYKKVKKIKKERAEEQYVPSPEEINHKLKRMKRSKSRDKDWLQ